MDKRTYMDVRKQLSFDKPLWKTLLVLFLDAALIYIAFWLIGLGSVSGFILSQLLLAVFYFHNFAILHECGHGNAHEKSWINTIIGHYSSIFCFMPYFPWKYIHSEHHVWAGNLDKDPTMSLLKKIKTEKKIPWIAKIGWRSWIPVSGLLQHFVFWLYPVTLIREGKMSGTLFWKCLFSVAWLASAYYALFSYLPQWVNFQNLWLSFLFYLVIVELVNLPHHVMMPVFFTSEHLKKLPLWQQNVTTRSCYYPSYLSELLTLNFNFHTEHHFYPNLPWYRLKKARALIKPLLGSGYTEVYGINWNLKNRSKPADNVFLADIPMPDLQPEPSQN